MFRYYLPLLFRADAKELMKQWIEEGENNVEEVAEEQHEEESNAD